MNLLRSCQAVPKPRLALTLLAATSSFVMSGPLVLAGLLAVLRPARS